MISFRTREDSIASSISIIAILMLAGTLAWMLLVPDPTEGGVARGRTQTERQLQKDIDNAKANNSALQGQIDPLVWTGTQETVGPQALATVIKLAKARNLKLVAFRPQRSVPQTNVSVLPFGISTQGAFLATMQFVKDLEDPKNRLAVSQVQISATDAGSDNVNGTVAVAAYLVPSTAPATPSPAPAVANNTTTRPTVKVTTPAGGKSAQRTK